MLGREEWHSRTTQVFFQVRSEGENSLFAPGPKTALGVGSNSTAVTTRPTKHGQIQRFVFPFFFFSLLYLFSLLFPSPLFPSSLLSFIFSFSFALLSFSFFLSSYLFLFLPLFLSFSLSCNLSLSHPLTTQHVISSENTTP